MIIVDPINKDPQAILDYSVDWTSYLSGDTIVTSAWSSSSTDLTLTLDTNDGSKSVVVVSGGTAGKTYTITNRITYERDGNSLSDDRSIVLFVCDK